MKRIGLFFAVLVFIFCHDFADAAPVKPAPAKNFAKSGQTVSTEYYRVTLPRDWIMPDPVKKRPHGISVAFANEKNRNAVTINILTIPMKAEDLAKSTIASMKKNGLKIGKLQKTGNLYRLEIFGKPGGEAWFGSDGKICAATVILGEKIDKKSINAFLTAFKPVTRELFPAAMK